MESFGGPRHASRAPAAADRAKSAPALFRRDRHQPDGGAETRETVSRRMAGLRCARGDRAHGRGGSAQTVATARAADLARAAQRRDDRRRAASCAGLAAEAGIYLRGTAAPPPADAMADAADGRDHRNQRALGVVSETRFCGDSPWG